MMKDPAAWLVLCAILIRSEWREAGGEAKLSGGRVIKLRRGQSLVGRSDLAEKTGLPKSTIRNALARLEKSEILALVKDRVGTIVTVLNWDIYQGSESDGGQPRGQPEDNLRTPSRSKTGKKTTAKATTTATTQETSSPAAEQDDWLDGHLPHTDNWVWKGSGVLAAEYPQHRSAMYRRACLRPYKEAIESGVKHEDILAGIRAWKESDEWKREGGRFIPSLPRFLLERMWEVVPEVKPYDPWGPAWGG